LKAEREELLERNGKLGLAYRELDTRNKRQEDFIFTVQNKILTLEAKNEELVAQIEAMEREKAQALEEKNEEGPEFREFGI